MKNLSLAKVLYFVLGISLSAFLLYRLVVTEELSRWDYAIMLILIGLSFARRSIFRGSSSINNDRLT